MPLATVSTARTLKAITPHDTNTIEDDTDALHRIADALWVSVTGHVKLTSPEGDTVTIQNVPVGWLEVKAVQVFATGTTATVSHAAYL